MNEIFTITAFVASVTFFIFSMSQVSEPSSRDRSVVSQQLTQKAFVKNGKPIVKQTYPQKKEKIRHTQSQGTLVYKTVSKNGKVSYSNTSLGGQNKSVKVFKMEPSKVSSQSSAAWVTPKPQQKITSHHVYFQRNYNQHNNDSGKTSLKTCRFYKKKFDWFSAKMRRGYTNNERDWLESNRVKYRDLLFWNCDSHKLL